MDETIRITYKTDENYSPVYVNGVYGGKNYKGEIILHFFCESFPVPDEEIREISQEGALVQVRSILPKELSAVRTIKQGVILTKENARDICDRLEKILEE